MLAIWSYFLSLVLYVPQRNIEITQREVCTFVLCSLATVLFCMFCIDPFMRMVTKSPKIGPLLIFSMSLTYLLSSPTTVSNETNILDADVIFLTIKGVQTLVEDEDHFQLQGKKKPMMSYFSCLIFRAISCGGRGRGKGVGFLLA
jgi:hypothetical protein